MIDQQAFDVMPRVYQTSIDTELMGTVVKIQDSQRFLEVGCGCGAVSLRLARRSKSGVGVDINPDAIANSIHNANRLGINNVSFVESDVFETVRGRFHVIVCNPPYNNSEPADNVDRMFWDPNDEMKRRFFAEVRGHLLSEGRVYFGWADFADLNPALPLAWARDAGLRYLRHYSALAPSGSQTFYVIVFGSSAGLVGDGDGARW